MPPILSRWATKLEADVAGMAIQIEPFHQFVAMWQMPAEGHSDPLASDMEVHIRKRCVTEFLHVEKMGHSGCDHSEALGDAFQQWQQQQLVTATGTDVYEHSMQALLHCCWKHLANSGDYVEKQRFVAEKLLY